MKELSPIKKLPYEIRQLVYRNLLSIRHTKQMTDPQGTEYYDLHPAIFSTCRQIYEEARPILYHANSFVLVVGEDSDLQATMRKFGVPTLNMRHTGQVYSLEMSISTPEPPSGELHVFMIASEDLAILCDLFWLQPVRRVACFAVHFHVYAPSLAIPESLSLRNALFAGFANLWRAETISIWGVYDHKLLAKLQAILPDVIGMTRTDALALVNALTLSALRYLAEHEHPRAAITYHKAYRAAWIMSRNHFHGIFARIREEPCNETRLWCILLVAAIQAAAGLCVAYMAMKEWRNALAASSEAWNISLLKLLWPDLVVPNLALASARTMWVLWIVNQGFLGFPK